MAGQCQRQFLLRDAAAIVGDADQFDATFFQTDLHCRSTGIEGVFEQFLEHGGRAFDDLASGDLADQEVGEQLDLGHRRIIPG